MGCFYGFRAEASSEGCLGGVDIGDVVALHILIPAFVEDPADR